MPPAFCILPLLVVLAAAGCQDRPRGVRPIDGPPSTIDVGPIDWDESAGVFVGVETFHSPDAPSDVPFAADDATDLAYLFTNELGLLAPSRAAVLLAGRPAKDRSREHLGTLAQQGAAVLGNVDAAHIYDTIGKQVSQVGPHGVLVLSVATHGYTTGGQHVLLTADSGITEPKGVILGNILRLQKQGRLILFVDACRERLAKTPAPDAPTAMTEAFFEELRGAGGYAVFSASAPGGFAYSDDATQNGFFTSALVDAFRQQAAAHTDGCALTLGSLDSEVSRSVVRRSDGRQKPEARFGGGLADLCLMKGGAEVGQIISPLPGAKVSSSGDVEFRTVRPGMYANVLLCAARNGVCFKQNRAPILMTARVSKTVYVQYGTADRFDIYVALCADRKFLQDERETDGLPLERDTHHVVHWLGPVTVTSHGKESP